MAVPFQLPTFDLNDPEVIARWDAHRAPSKAHRTALVTERAARVWDLGWTRQEYTASMQQLRLTQLRTNTLNWEGNVWEDKVFKAVERRAAEHLWHEPFSAPGAAVLRPQPFLADLDSRGFLADPCLRLGIDNAGLPALLATTQGHSKDYAAELLTVSRIHHGDAVHPVGVMLGSESKYSIRALLSNAPAISCLRRAGCKAILTGDEHGMSLALPSEPSLCPFCGLRHADLLPGDARLGNEPGRLPDCQCSRNADGSHPDTPCWLREWRSLHGADEAVASLSVRPGLWHSIGTLITHSADAHGEWGKLHAELSRRPNAVMNNSVSITGCEIISGARPPGLPTAMQAICDARGWTALARAHTATQLLEAVRPIHREMIAKKPSAWTIGCHAIYDITASARLLFGGKLTPFREKPVERGHQLLKAEVPKSHHRLLRACGRARWAAMNEGL